MKRLFAVLGVLMTCGLAHADTLDLWTFDNPPVVRTAVYGGTSTLAPPVIGTGWLVTNCNPGYVTTFYGASGQALAIQAGSSLQNNGRALTFHVPTTGYKSLHLSFYTNRSATGFNQDALWVFDGLTWWRVATFNPEYNGYGWSYLTWDLTGYANLNNNPKVLIEIDLSGASYWNGNNRFDNVAVTGTKQ